MLTERTHCDIWQPYQPIPRLRSRSSSSPWARALVLSPPHKINDHLPIAHLLGSCRIPRIPSRTTSTEEFRFPEACRGETAHPDRVYAFPGLCFVFPHSPTSELIYNTARRSSPHAPLESRPNSHERPLPEIWMGSRCIRLRTPMSTQYCRPG